MACASAALPAFLLTALAGVDNKYVQMINDALFVCEMREYLVDDMLVGTYQTLVAERLSVALTYMSTTIMTIWVAYQGFMIISGTNRQPVLALAYRTGKMVLILSLVALIARKSPVIAETVLNFQGLITAAIVGEGTDIYRTIDINLALSMAFNAIVDGLVGGQQAKADGKSLTTMAGLIGQSGPAMVMSAYSLAAEIFISLSIMLSPMFIFFLLFQQTAGKFWTWVRYLLGTMFSLAVLVLVGSVLLKMMIAYGAGVIAAFYLNGSALSSIISFDIAGGAMRMGMMGALSTALLVMIPPVIMGFFNSGASMAANALQGAMGGGAAAGVMKALQKDGAAGEAGPSGNPGAAGGDGSPTGSAALNRQIHQAIASKSLQSSDSGDGEAAGGRAMLAGSRGNAAGAQTNHPGVMATRAKERELAASGELRPNPVTGVYEAPETTPSLRSDPSLGRGGHLPVSGSSTPAAPAPAPTVTSSATGAAAGGRSAAEVDGSVSRAPGGGPSDTPVHALLPAGATQAEPSNVRSPAPDMLAREQRNPAAPRPTMPGSVHVRPPR